MQGAVANNRTSVNRLLLVYTANNMNRIFKTFCLIVSCCVHVSAAEVLERHIDVRFQQTPLKEALAAVAQKAGFEWSYNANLVDAGKKISLVANDWTVRETLFELLGEGYEFKPNGNYLILKKRKKPADQLSGYIKDPATGQRITNATVYDRRTLRATTTDSNGYYELRVKKSTQVAIARLNYRDTIFSVTTDSPRFQKVDLQVNTALVTHTLTLEENMQIAAGWAEKFFKASLEKWNAVNVPDSLHRRYQVSFLPKLGTNHTLSGKVVNDWSLNILAGSSMGSRKLEVGGIGNFTRKNMTGLQVGGIFNELRGNTDGIQIGGIYNHTGDTLRGVQVGGIVNVAHRTDDLAVQVGGIANFLGQTNGGLSVQVGGIMNQAPGCTVSVQVGGIVNHARQISGLQAAGLVNVTDSLDGFQVAGISNRARKVRGIQIGLINSANELEGIQIGFINRSGRRVLPFFNWGKKQ